MPDLDARRREALRRVVAEKYYGGDIPAALAPLIAGWLAEAEAEALREAADAWTQGQWSDVMLPKPTPPAVPVIAYANRVGDWLRDRAGCVTCSGRGVWMDEPCSDCEATP